VNNEIIKTLSPCGTQSFVMEDAESYGPCNRTWVL